MNFRGPHPNGIRKSVAARLLGDRAVQITLIILGIILIIWGVTLYIPRPSSTVRPHPTVPPTTISPQPTVNARSSSTPQAATPFATIAPEPTVNTSAQSIPVLAYYYIWFDPQSWDRAKKDYPLLGRYSSDDANVMRQHIRWAKQAGIDGFIVSWKGTDKLNRRLDQLVKIADQENFNLAIIYEGLDFQRDPIPVQQVNADLGYFIDHYADEHVFDIFQKPMVIWSGTWQYSPEEIQSVAQDKRERLLILASEKNVQGYQRLAKFVDGDAYYWSSVNPDTNSGHEAKLKAMADAIHQSNGIWIAPAAPGYDSRLLGGTTVVDRQNGETLRQELEAALQSNPDAIGLISWNEFSENSHVEPSQNYGDQALKVLAQTRLVAPELK